MIWLVVAIATTILDAFLNHIASKSKEDWSDTWFAVRLIVCISTPLIGAALLISFIAYPTNDNGDTAILRLIVGIATLAGGIYFAKKFFSKGNRTGAQEKPKFDKARYMVQRKKEWDARIRELNINLTKAIKVKWYPEHGEATTDIPIYIYLWKSENMVSLFSNYEECDGYYSTDAIKEWEVYNWPIKNIVDVVKQDGFCVIRFVAAQFWFAIEDYKKIFDFIQSVKQKPVLPKSPQSGTLPPVKPKVPENKPVISSLPPTKESGMNDDSITAGTIIKGKKEYTIIKQITPKAPDATRYLCSSEDNKLFVAKIYNNEKALNPSKIKAALSIESNYVSKTYEAFTHKGKTVVILEYTNTECIKGKKYDKNQWGHIAGIVEALNEGLHAIHSAGLHHKDIRPENIIVSKDENFPVMFVDFGCSSQYLTPVYAAPEVFNGLTYSESDYFSLGVTLYEFVCGYPPYKGLSKDSKNILYNPPFPQDVEPAVQTLIAHLIYPDIIYDVNNPNRRWTYKDVDEWLWGKDESVTPINNVTSTTNENTTDDFVF